MTRQSLRAALAEFIGIDLSADQHAGLRIDIHHLPGGHYDEPHTVRTVKARDLAKLLDEHAKELAHAEVCKQQQRIDHYQEQNRQLHERIKELESMTETNDTTESALEKLKGLYYQLDAKLDYAMGMLIVHPDRANAQKIVSETSGIRFEIDMLFSGMEEEEADHD